MGRIVMEFMNVVGSRRSIRWFRSWKPVEPGKGATAAPPAGLTLSGLE
jgi:hypothetical protein